MGQPGISGAYIITCLQLHTCACSRVPSYVCSKKDTCTCVLYFIHICVISEAHLYTSTCDGSVCLHTRAYM